MNKYITITEQGLHYEGYTKEEVEQNLLQYLYEVTEPKEEIVKYP